MTTEPEDRDAEIMPFRQRPPAEAADVSFEVELDDGPPAPAVLVDPPPGTAVLLPIIPDHLRTIAKIRAHGKRLARMRGHDAGWHAVRAPKYLIEALAWAVVGVFRVIGAQLAWWWALDLQYLVGQSVAGGDDKAALRLHKEAKETRRFRGYVLLGEAVALGTFTGLLIQLGPWWAWAAVVAVALPLLATAGRPADRRIIGTATVTARFRKLNADIVLRAYYAAGLGHPDKPDQQVTFGTPMARDGEGSRVTVDLPHGKGLKDAIEAKDKIASGLDVTESQVYLHRDPTSYRRHVLWVADRDPLAVPVGRTPLLACKPVSIWKPAPMGLDERGQLVSVPLMWNSVLVGALPRQGKTFSARLLGLYAALDPHVKMGVFDAKGSPDWRKFALVADSCAFGLTPTRQGLPPEILLDCLTDIKNDVQDRYQRLSEMPTDICPDGKLTPQIARDPRHRMPVRVLILEEVQEYYDLGDISKELAALITFLVKVAPGAGVIVLASTQKPSGIGSGEVGRQFTSARDQFQVRFSLRTSSWQVSEMVLGQGAYSEGLDSSTLLPQYKGVGILRGAADASPTVRTYLADGQDAEKILVAARAIRERAGTLSGMALGEVTPKLEASILADVLAVLGDEPRMHWAPLAALLRARFPERHADATAESVSAQCRGAGVPSDQVKCLGVNRQGCRRADIERIERAAR